MQDQVTVVFWATRKPDDPEGSLEPHVEEFLPGPDQLKQVLGRCAELRSNGVRYVTTTSADVVATGIYKDSGGVWRLPNGQPYTWTKKKLGPGQDVNSKA